MNETINLTGEWIGFYPGHFDEVIEIRQNGDWLEAIKITGDEFVPAGEVTWRANLETGEAEGQLSESEFRNPRFVPGRLTILSDDRIKFTWLQFGSVEYRRDE